MSIKNFFERAWKWVQALFDKYDDEIQKMGEALLPLVVDVAFRPELSGADKKKIVADAVLDAAEKLGKNVSASMINEAIEVAANRYNIQIGKTTKDNMDATMTAVLEAARKHADGALKLTGKEADDAGVVLSNQSL